MDSQRLTSPVTKVQPLMETVTKLLWPFISASVIGDSEGSELNIFISSGTDVSGAAYDVGSSAVTDLRDRVRDTVPPTHEESDTLATSYYANMDASFPSGLCFLRWQNFICCWLSALHLSFKCWCCSAITPVILPSHAITLDLRIGIILNSFSVVPRHNIRYNLYFISNN